MSHPRRDPAAAHPLPEGVYEHLVTEALERGLAVTSPLEPVFSPLDDTEAPAELAHHVGREIERALGALPSEQRAEESRRLAVRLLDVLTSLSRGEDVADTLRDQRPTEPARKLIALHGGVLPARPSTPLSRSTLLTRSRSEPPLGHELAREIATADGVDAIIAFVTVSGVNMIRDALQRFSLRPNTRFRLLTTTFTGVTEQAALDELARLPNAEVRVSFDTRRTRLHAKAWLFHRRSGLTTSYVGSANLTSTALGAGHEWMMKACASDLPHVIQQFRGTFDTLWADVEFEHYDPNDETLRTRLTAALSKESSDDSRRLLLVALRPYPFQQEILDRLAAERILHGRCRNLVVAATGTGKTVIAALDYARISAAAGVPPRLLFLAHRRETLEQALTTFRHALQDHAFGELFVGNHEPARWDHVFASIQSAAARDLVEKLGVDHFRHVVIDECHHVPARSYRDIVPRLRPEILVGLTATPERTDGKSLLPDFDDHIAAELRLWRALESQILVPFDYFGISDGVDLRDVRWTRSGYDTSALGSVYTGNTARADLIRRQLQLRVADMRRIRAIGFCVSVEHAEFMAERFCATGIPALAVHAGSAHRDDAPAKLRDREVNVLFTCDLYNEGIDLPFVDTLLLLRPTQSTTLFLQQLGRGLRLHSGKTSCLVLDFIGQHRSEFRFDGILSAISGVPRARVPMAIKEGFPFLPSGCALQLDDVAREVILRSLRDSLAGAQRIQQEIRDLSGDGGRITLAQFLEQTGRELDDIYDAGGWTTLQRHAGVAALQPHEDPAEIDALSKKLGQLRHVDEPERLDRYRDLLAATAQRGSAPEISPLDRRRLLMLESQLHHRGVLRVAEEILGYLATRPSIVREFGELCEVLDDRVSLASQVRPVSEWTLDLHRHYSRREILAGVGHAEAGKKSAPHQSGLLRLEAQQREILFVTLDKSGRSFSPTTRYRDYAISPDRFHWETQSTASIDRPSGRRYVESPENGWSFFLFVRTRPREPFSFLGPAVRDSHSGDRPIAITWRLEHPMPAALFDRYASLRTG